MKKFAKIAAIGAAAALTLAGCGTAPDETPSKSPEATSTDSAEPTPTDKVDFLGCMVSDFGGFDDKSFNETSYNGLKRAETELGITMKVAESTDASDYPVNINAMVQEGCDIIVNVGFGLADDTLDAAIKNPDTNFALVDSGVSEPQDNVKALLFNTQEAAFLAGYVAAGVTKTGTVATFGGMAFPSVTIFMDGFVDGVAAYNEANGTDVKAIGWDKETQKGSMTETFDEIGAGKTMSEDLINQGADIIMPVAGPVGAGALAAASEKEGIYVIGVDSDFFVEHPQYQDYVLTSVMKAMDLAVFETVQSAMKGEFSAETYVGTLANGGVALAEFHNLDSLVSDDVKKDVEDLKAKIISGELVIESPSATEVN
ncbi:BMP family ABC transporter substrate-binding protein [Jonesiaceae bacterium BS-20]|uniref:BMP family ABC transporter substrate-binding protein n=1 Tax=Jonesiaceae bacterium BS-20 TaxID=3120821 RepID=A0AAU7DXT9_9MICO